LKKGDYFGEIAVTTNLKRTCSACAVNNVTCGLISMEDLQTYIKTNSDFKNRMIAKVNTYQDNFFKFIITAIRNVGVFRIVPNHIVKNLLFKLKEKKYMKGS